MHCESKTINIVEGHVYISLYLLRNTGEKHQQCGEHRQKKHIKAHSRLYTYLCLDIKAIQHISLP